MNMPKTIETLPLLISLIVVVVLLLAGCSSPAPTATSTPTSTPPPPTATQVDAAAALYSACRDITAERSYDFNTVITSPYYLGGEQQGIGTYSYDARVQGDDVHMVVEHREGDNLYQFETLVVNGQEYWQIEGFWVRPETLVSNFPQGLIYGLGTVNTLIGAERDTGALCPEGSVTSQGTEVVGGVETQRYSITESNPSELAPDVQQQILDYWVSPTGQMLKTEQSLTYTEGGAMEFVTTFSGVGEANIITAPTEITTLPMIQ